ncbi:exopolysaccharide biosynthesis polyprenyl glycosylphosphotransferase [Actinomadura yumaensis]|uniref:exopolysaccharide biosynthesis polyprenyl glycosylphosphotransferase n=1 Tax=Actinomadura yumaensis TaxID=111807 RepID=UPI00362417E1
MPAQAASEPALAGSEPAGAHGGAGRRGGPFRRTPLARLLAAAYPAGLAGIDAVAAVVVVLVAAPGEPGPAAAVTAAVALVCVNAQGGLLRAPRELSLLRDARPLAGRTALLAVVAGTLCAAPSAPSALSTASGPRFPAVPPGVPGGEAVAGTVMGWAAAAIAGTAVALAGRALAHAAVRSFRTRRTAARPALIVGGGPLSLQIAGILQRHGEFGLIPIGRVDTGISTAERPGELPAELPVLGDCEDLSRILWDHGIGTVVVNAEEVERAWLDVIVRICFALRCETLLMLSPIDALSVDGARVEHLAGMPCVRLPRPRHEGLARHVKRAFDAAAALAALLLLLPVLAACALAVRLDTGPGVIFRQRRVGLDGREFVLLKFRTLLPADDHEADTRWSVDGDERLKPVGRFLRDTCLDELPQLWNVVRGDMSLVGPRPERPHFVRHFAGRCPGYTLRHRMRGGMTGWSQVHGLRGDTSIDLRARYDNHYIDGWSLGSDLKILLKTVRVVLLGNRR